MPHSSEDKDQFLREDIRQLGRLLGDVIRSQHGDDVFNLIESVRQKSIEFQRSKDDGARAYLEAAMGSLSQDHTTQVIRAFSFFSLLANIAEDQHHIRRTRAHLHAGSAPKEGSIEHAISSVIEAGASTASLKNFFENALVSPVLTAHPTEVRRRSMVDRETEISRLMALRRHHLPADLDADIRERLFREIALMWRTRLYRPERITVKDEIRNALSIVRTSILPAIIDLYADWSKEIGEHGQMAPLLKMGSWLGGDRDGHPGVNGDTLKLALASQSRVILDWYASEVRKLWSNLAVSTAYAPVSEELLALAAQTNDPSVHRLDEPYRLALELIFDRLSAVSQKLTNQWVAFATARTNVEPYGHPDAFVSDLKIIIDSLERNGGERLVGSALRTLVEVAQACGFHLMSLDLRQNADVHERTLHELFQRAGGLRHGGSGGVGL